MPAFSFNMAMNLSLSSGVIAAAEQSPTPHSAPRMQYLSMIACRFLKISQCYALYDIDVDTHQEVMFMLPKEGGKLNFRSL